MPRIPPCFVLTALLSLSACGPATFPIPQGHRQHATDHADLLARVSAIVRSGEIESKSAILSYLGVEGATQDYMGMDTEERWASLARLQSVPYQVDDYRFSEGGKLLDLRLSPKLCIGFEDMVRVFGYNFTEILNSRTVYIHVGSLEVFRYEISSNPARTVTFDFGRKDCVETIRLHVSFRRQAA